MPLRLLPLVLLALGAVAHGAETRSATLEVSKMDCAVCPITVRAALEKLPGVQAVKVDFKTKRAIVTFDPARVGTEALTRATADAGFPSTVLQVR